jgi:hypothetical protein
MGCRRNNLHKFVEKNSLPGPGSHTIKSLSGEASFRTYTSQHRSLTGVKVPKAQKLAKVQKNSEPGPNG